MKKLLEIFIILFFVVSYQNSIHTIFEGEGRDVSVDWDIKKAEELQEQQETLEKQQEEARRITEEINRLENEKQLDAKQQKELEDLQENKDQLEQDIEETRNVIEKIEVETPVESRSIELTEEEQQLLDEINTAIESERKSKGPDVIPEEMIEQELKELDDKLENYLTADEFEMEQIIEEIQETFQKKKGVIKEMIDSIPEIWEEINSTQKGSRKLSPSEKVFELATRVDLPNLVDVLKTVELTNLNLESKGTQDYLKENRELLDSLNNKLRDLQSSLREELKEVLKDAKTDPKKMASFTFDVLSLESIAKMQTEIASEIKQSRRYETFIDGLLKKNRFSLIEIPDLALNIKNKNFEKLNNNLDVLDAKLGIDPDISVLTVPNAYIYSKELKALENLKTKLQDARNNLALGESNIEINKKINDLLKKINDKSIELQAKWGEEMNPFSEKARRFFSKIVDFAKEGGRGFILQDKVAKAEFLKKLLSRDLDLVKPTVEQVNEIVEDLEKDITNLNDFINFAKLAIKELPKDRKIRQSILNKLNNVLEESLAQMKNFSDSIKQNFKNKTVTKDYLIDYFFKWFNAENTPSVDDINFIYEWTLNDEENKNTLIRMQEFVKRLFNSSKDAYILYEYINNKLLNKKGKILFYLGEFFSLVSKVFGVPAKISSSLVPFLNSKILRRNPYVRMMTSTLYIGSLPARALLAGTALFFEGIAVGLKKWAVRIPK